MEKISMFIKTQEDYSKIHTTTDYDLFEKMLGQRNVERIGKLLGKADQRKLEIKEYPFMAPIIVNDRFEVVDGQHRLHICQEFKLTAEFIIRDNANIKDVLALCNSQEHWDSKKYIDSYAQLGNETYKMLKKYMGMTGLPDKSVWALLTSGLSISNKKLKDGEAKILNFHAAEKSFEENYRMYTEIVRAYKGDYALTSGQFMCALMKFINHPAYDHTYFVTQRVARYSYMMKSYQSQKDYLSALCEMNNYNSKKFPIYFQSGKKKALKNQNIDGENFIGSLV